jgi:ribose transport system substrate-binding protein
MGKLAKVSFAVLFTLMAASGCGQRGSTTAGDGAESTNPRDFKYPIQAGKYTILGILTDNKDHVKAKSNAEDALTRDPDIKCMVGLWAYNPPAILEAVKARGKTGQIKIVGFDENKITLQGIKEGEVFGTIVQQPFVFGYKSVELLAGMVRGKKVEFPRNSLFIPTRSIRQDNVDAFQVEVENMYAGKGDPPKAHFESPDTEKSVRVAFLTNSVDDFWKLAEEGCKLAESTVNAQCLVHMPSRGTVEEQKQAIEQFITEGYQGLAISPIDPANQAEVINKACEKMLVICQDSDAPNTNRKFYLGTSNYMAGREAGKMVKEACPEGGKVMIFVGKLEVLNAQERGRGVIDELLDKPIPAEFTEK